jgi:hypothetical protein
MNNTELMRFESGLLSAQKTLMDAQKVLALSLVLLGVAVYVTRSLRS